MTIHIQDSTTIAAIQKEFTGQFPFLKLEFFSKPHRTGGGTEKKYMKEGNTRLSECRTNHSSGELSISGDMSVAALEKLFADNFGLYVQVFRRSGKLWLETTATDNWSLYYQNEQGRELSSGSLGNDREEIDYHEQE